MRDSWVFFHFIENTVCCAPEIIDGITKCCEEKGYHILLTNLRLRYSDKCLGILTKFSKRCHRGIYTNKIHVKDTIAVPIY